MTFVIIMRKLFRGVAQLVARMVRDHEAVSSSLATPTNKKVSFVYRTKETFLRDAFLAEHDAHCVRDADFVCDARLRRVLERIASPITAQRHHLSLICKEAHFAI